MSGIHPATDEAPRDVPPRAVIVDLPFGFAADPADRLGLGAVTARWLLAPAAGGPGDAVSRHAWRTRHRLTENWSSFAFWSCLDDRLEYVAETFEGVRTPDARQLEDLITAQRRLLTGNGTGTYGQLLGLLEKCAWGETSDSLGTAGTLSAITADDVARHLAAAMATGLRQYHADSPVRYAGPATSAPDRPWRGGFRKVEFDAATTRVAVAVPINPPAPGSLELGAEILGRAGLDGRLATALRSGQGLAYGLGSFVLGGGQAVAAHALVSPENAVTAAQLLLDTILGVLTEVVPVGERQAAADRARTSLLLQLEQPFGAADEVRRAAMGEPTLTEIAEFLPIRAAEGALPSARSGSIPALAAAGALTSDSRHALERMCA